MVAARMAVAFPADLRSVDVTFHQSHIPGTAPPTQAEQEFLDRRRTIAYWDNAYAHIGHQSANVGVCAQRVVDKIRAITEPFETNPAVPVA